MSNPAFTIQPAIHIAQATRAGQASQAAQAARATPAGQTRSAIEQASQRTGADFNYLMAQAQIESSMDPMAQARTSSASGLYQFIDQTWLSTLDQHGEELGYGQLAQAIETDGGRARITNPDMRDMIMGLRFDPQASAMMAGALANDNRAALTPVLGREPDASELYLAHFLGAQGATDFLSTLSDNPDASAASILPRAARANRAIFYDRSGAPNSVSEVMDLVRGKVDTAMQLTGTTATTDPGWYPVQDAAAHIGARRVPAMSPSGTGAPATSAPARPVSRPMQVPSIGSLPTSGSLPAMGGLPSMADTLRNSFGLGDENADMPGHAHVRGAYARLQAFGL